MPRRLILSEHHIQHLLSLPETGMGYQRVRITLKSGAIVNNVMVENASHAIVPDGSPVFTDADIQSIELESNAAQCS